MKKIWMQKRPKTGKIDPIRYLIDFPGLWRKNEKQRMTMTISCRDTDYIPKVENAGDIVEVEGLKVQIMHEGSRVVCGGYHGEWMTKIIETLNGHHEPQEEKVFHEILKRVRPNSTMIELGSFWSYYSLWFTGAVKNSKAICCEPDPSNLEVGKKNAKLNNRNMDFIHAASGLEDGRVIALPLDSSPGKNIDVKIRSVDSIIKERNLKSVEVLHLDIQGAEMDALQGAIESIKAQRIRFIFVSTHHYFFSGNPNTHNECLSFLKDNGAHIISSHTVAESFSGDGLIVASFDQNDSELKIETTLCHTDNSLFRSPEDDVALLAALINENGQMV